MGELITFYRPAPKPPATVAEVEEQPVDQLPAAELLSGVMQQVETIRDIVIISRDANGHCGLISNLGSVADCILLLEQTKLKVLNATPEAPQPRGTA